MISVALGLFGLVTVLGLGATQILKASTRRELDERLRAAVHVAEHVDAALAKDVVRLRRIGIAAFADASGRADLLKGLADQFDLMTWAAVTEVGQPVWTNAPLAVRAPLNDAAAQAAQVPGAPPRFSGLVRWGDVPIVVYAEQLAPGPGGGGRAIVGAFDLRDRRLEEMLGALELGVTGHTVIVDSQGWVLVGPRRLRYTQREHPEFLVSLIRSGTPQVGRTAEGSGAASEDAHIMAFAPMSAAPWGVGYGQAEAEVLLPIVRLRRLLLAIGGGGLLAALVYAWRDTRAVIAPLRALTAAAARMAGGDLGTPIGIRRSDELGVLADAFEQMRVQLNESLQATRARAREARALYRVTGEILASLDLRTILHTVADQARTLLQADGAMLCLALEGANPTVLRPAAASAGCLPLRRETRACPGLEAEPCGGPGESWGECAVFEKERGAHRLAVPLRAGQDIIGALCVVRRTPFEPAAVELLAGLASQAAVAIQNARLHARVQGLATLEERERLARELHDGLAQALGYLHTTARALRAGCPNGRLADDLDEMAATAGRAYDEVRQAIFGLRTMVARGPELVPAITEYLHDFSERTGLPVELTVTRDVQDLSLGAEVQIIRIVQEALTNVWKHARAESARVVLARQDDALSVEIADDGVGFDPDGANGGFGLQSMRERAAGIGAALRIDSASGRGTRVVLRLPTAPAGTGEVPVYGQDPPFAG